MVIKGLVDEDFVNYKKPSMFIAFPSCTFKCERECGQTICQNNKLVHSPDIEISWEDIVQRYIENPISKAIVFGGLEPFDDFINMYELLKRIRQYTSDDVVIYTGYRKDEIFKYINVLRNNFYNIVIKYGRFIPDQQPHYDDVLGIKLASDNQYAERIS